MTPQEYFKENRLRLLNEMRRLMVEEERHRKQMPFYYLYSYKKGLCTAAKSCNIEGDDIFRGLVRHSLMDYLGLAFFINYGRANCNCNVVRLEEGCFWWDISEYRTFRPPYLTISEKDWYIVRIAFLDEVIAKEEGKCH